MNHLQYMGRALLYRLRFPGSQIRIHPSSRIPWRCAIRINRGDTGTIRIGENCWIEEYARLMTYGGSIVIGPRSSVNEFTVIRGGGGVTIGRGVRIGPHCVLSGISHRFDRTDIPLVEQGAVRRPIVVEDDVWIGAHSTIIDGVTVRRGTVIGAGSVVTKDTPEYSLVAGCPARLIRSRKAASGPAGA